MRPFDSVINTNKSMSRDKLLGPPTSVARSLKMHEGRTGLVIELLQFEVEKGREGLHCIYEECGFAMVVRLSLSPMCAVPLRMSILSLARWTAA